ncbi:ABC transporter permease [Christensenellaceae bacterium OttesenSCG-928-K19]|nr:ABC transporter permease [Christensenellaceae bacterium OttesenSCG-928-K19]
MQVFKCFLKIVRQNIGMLIMYLMIFIILVAAFSNFGSTQQLESYSDTKVNLAIIDRDSSGASRALTGILAERHTLISLPDDVQALQDALYNRDVAYILFIPAGYEQTLLSGKSPMLENAQIPSSYSGEYVTHLVEGYTSTLGVYLGAGFSLADALINTANDLSSQAAVTMTHPEGAEAPGIYYYYKYLSYAVLLMIIFGLCPVLMVFNQKQIAMRMNSSALPLRSKNFGLGLGAIALAAICFAVLILFGFIMYGSDMLQSGALICLLNAACFLATSVTLAFLIGQLSKSGNMLSALANAVGLGLSFLGGVFVPLEVMGSDMQRIAQLFPTYWYVHVTDLSIGSGAASQLTTEMAQSMGIQLLFAAAFLAAALVVSRQKQRTA